MKLIFKIFSENIYVDIGTKILLIIHYFFVFFAVHDDKNQTLSQLCLFLSKIGRKKMIDISCYNNNNVDGYTVKSDQSTI